jgi:hypothetical protein
MFILPNAPVGRWAGERYRRLGIQARDLVAVLFSGVMIVCGECLSCGVMESDGT